MNQYLKTHPEPFQAVADGVKTFEFRNNDRRFRVGDILYLQEWDPVKGERTGREQIREVTYVLPGGAYGVPDGFCVLGMRK